MSSSLPRIDYALRELRERGDAGEIIHMILVDVAEQHAIRAEHLRQKWENIRGPIELDRDTHKVHYQYLETREKIISDCRALAREVWEENVRFLDHHRWLRIDWRELIAFLVPRIDFNYGDLEALARSEFGDEIQRLEDARRREQYEKRIRKPDKGIDN